MESYRLKINPGADLADLSKLDRISSIALHLTSEEGALYYSQFSSRVEEVVLEGSSGETLGRVVLVTKKYYIDGEEKRVLFVNSISSKASRTAFLGWSQKLLPHILKRREEWDVSYVLFLLEKREAKNFHFFIRPRNLRPDAPRFSLIRRMNVNLVHGSHFFGPRPLENLIIRPAEEGDLDRLSGFIKESTLDSSFGRICSEEFLRKEFKNWRGLGINNVLLALTKSERIVGSLGAFNLNQFGNVKVEIDDARFHTLQQGLKVGSYLRDLRPVLPGKENNFSLFTHMYFNNNDIFYSLIHEWLTRTKKESPIFVFPHYLGDLKTSPPPSLVVTSTTSELYLMQGPGEPPPEILKPRLFSPAFDIDLPFLV